MTTIAEERRLFAEEGLLVVRRETAGLVGSYTSSRTVSEPARYLFAHITVTPDPIDLPKNETAAWRVVERIGIQRFGASVGISYNTGAMQSGRLYEGQPMGRRGAHTVNDKKISGFPSNLNPYGRACAIVQNVADAVTDEQIDSMAQWGAAMRRTGLADKKAEWYPHRYFAWKSCPGDLFMLEWANLIRLTDKYTKSGLPGSTTPPDPGGPMPDHVLTAKDLAAIKQIVDGSVMAQTGPKILSYKKTGVEGVHTYKVEDNLGVHLTQAELTLCRKLGIPEGAGLLGGTPQTPLGDDFVGTVAFLDGPLQSVE